MFERGLNSEGFYSEAIINIIGKNDLTLSQSQLYFLLKPI